MKNDIKNKLVAILEAIGAYVLWHVCTRVALSRDIFISLNI